MCIQGHMDVSAWCYIWYLTDIIHQKYDGRRLCGDVTCFDMDGPCTPFLGTTKRSQSLLYCIISVPNEDMVAAVRLPPNLTGEPGASAVQEHVPSLTVDAAIHLEAADAAP